MRDSFYFLELHWAVEGRNKYGFLFFFFFFFKELKQEQNCSCQKLTKYFFAAPKPLKSLEHLWELMFTLGPLHSLRVCVCRLYVHSASHCLGHHSWGGQGEQIILSMVWNNFGWQGNRLQVQSENGRIRMKFAASPRIPLTFKPHTQKASLTSRHLILLFLPCLWKFCAVSEFSL